MMTDVLSSKTTAEPSTSKPTTPQQAPAPESQTPSTSNQQEDVPKSETVSSFGLHRYHSKVCLNPDKCILSPEMLSKSPSRDDGVSVELEKDLRYLGCELIQSASILLKIPQVAAATAQILYQRYFYVKSFVRNDFEHVAMACVALASKIEEDPRRPRDVINVFHHLKQKNKCQMDPKRTYHVLKLDEEYATLKAQVIKAERRVLKELGFCVHVKHPHKMITAIAKAVDCVDNHEMIQRAWNYMNDGLRTDIFMRYSPETIAAACIFLSSRVLKVPLPMTPSPWWILFNAEQGDIWEISIILLRMYQRQTPLSWSRVDREINALRQKYQEAQMAKQKAIEEEMRKAQEQIKAAKEAYEKERRRQERKERKEKEDEERKERKRKRGRSRSTSSSGSARSRTRSPRRRDRSRDRDRHRERDRRRRHDDRRYCESVNGDVEKRQRESPSENRPPKARHLADIGVRLNKSKEKERNDRERRRRTPPSSAEKARERAPKESRHKRTSSKEREREVIAALGRRSQSPSSRKKRNDAASVSESDDDVKRRR